jgi:hypothetical protein
MRQAFRVVVDVLEINPLEFKNRPTLSLTIFRGGSIGFSEPDIAHGYLTGKAFDFDSDQPGRVVG